MTPLRTLITALIAGSLTAGTAHAAGEFTVYYTKAGGLYGPRRPSSATSGLRKQISQAERDLARAYAASTKTDTSADEVKAAQDNLNKARRDYTAMLVTARKSLDDHPQVAPHRKVVRDLEAKLAGESDLKARTQVSTDLMHARGKMYAAETEILSIDPDLAIAKAAVADAAAAVKQAQSNGQAQRQQDPAVAAARDRLQALRRQLAGR